MAFATASKLSWKEEKSPRFARLRQGFGGQASKPEPAAKTLSTLREIISRLGLSIFTFTARSAGIPWTAPPKHFAPFAISTQGAAPLHFYLPLRPRRWIISS